MEMLWHLSNKEIEDWLESNRLAFVEEESARSWLSTKIWLERYLYTDIHEIFFAEFPIVLHEWFPRLET